MPEHNEGASHDTERKGKVNSPLRPRGPASEVYLFDRQGHDDSAWLIGWHGARLPDSLQVWILVALEASSGQCRQLRAHHSREPRCVVDDLDSALRRSRRILHTLHLSDSDWTMTGALLERWAMLHGIVLMYNPPCRPRSGSALEAYARMIQADVLERVRPQSLAQLNTELAVFRTKLQ